MPRRRRRWHRATASQSVERISDPFAQRPVAERGEEDLLEGRGAVPRPQRSRLAAVDHDAAVEQHDLVARGAGEVQILGREQDAASARGERRNGLAEDDDRLRVERGGRLVDEDQRRRKRERRNRARLPPQAAGERPEPLAAPARRARTPSRAPPPARSPARRRPRARGRARRAPSRSARRTPSARPERARTQHARRATRPGSRQRAIAPASTESRPAAAWSSVVLPEPFGPTRPTTRPRARRGRRRRGRRARRSACRRPAPASGAGGPAGGRHAAALPPVSELAAATDNLEPRPAERDLAVAAVVAAPGHVRERDRVGEPDDDDPPDDVLGLRQLAACRRAPGPNTTDPRGRVLCPCSLL